MTVHFFGNGIISQFEGWDDLIELDWNHYRKKYGSISRIDYILEAEGDSVNRYKVSKQPDTVMLLYLFSGEELYRLFSMPGYRLTPEIISKTIDYYSQRTTFGSTLSHVVQSFFEAQRNRRNSWKHFTHSLIVDKENLQGSTGEGIHVGAMGGTIDLLQRGYCGIRVHEKLTIDPDLPNELTQANMNVIIKQNFLSLYISQDNVTVKFIDGISDSISCAIYGKTVTVTKRESVTVASREKTNG